jgi:photosystem II stability/assembly factor-like uncharacterized protein
MKNFIKIIFLIFVVFVFSGCSLDLSGTSKNSTGGFLASIDRENKWEARNRYDETKNISSIDILTMVIDPEDANTIYLGSKDDGIFVSHDDGGDWDKIAEFLPTKVYGIAINHYQPETIYATGVLGKRGKIFRTDDGGKNWQEIYSEPADGTVVISLAISKTNPQVVYAGTSSGMVIKTYDGGKTWENFYTDKAPITKIVFDEKNENLVYFIALGKGVLMTKDGGKNFSFIDNSNSENKQGIKFSGSVVRSIAVDSKNSGVAYVGTAKGMFKISNSGTNIEEVSIIGSSKKFPIYAVAVNPENSNEIVYAAAQAIYRTVDGGSQWSVFQLETKKSVGILKYNSGDASRIYAGLRNF